jgi:co-chaperonin GroES (HSP10)|tara:strand:- start:1033 stop:1350 length:318 start_codon:yes stop_codon:yes gene_type:complete
MKIRPLKGRITAQLLEDPRKESVTKAGVILLADNATEEGMKPRWFKALAVHPEEKDVKEGDYILVAHGRWSREYKRENKDGETEVLIIVESESVLGINDEYPKYI